MHSQLRRKRRVTVVGYLLMTITVTCHKLPAQNREAPRHLLTESHVGAGLIWLRRN